MSKDIEKVKSNAGRPTDYNAEKQAMADEYIYCYQDFGNVVPSLAGLACYIGVNRDTVYEWRDSYPQFSDTCKNIITIQEMVALDNGLIGKFNAQITKLVLANHGYHEKQQLDNTSSDGSMSTKSIDTSKLSTQALQEIMSAHESANTDRK